MEPALLKLLQFKVMRPAGIGGPPSPEKPGKKLLGPQPIAPIRTPEGSVKRSSLKNRSQQSIRNEGRNEPVGIVGMNINRKAFILQPLVLTKSDRIVYHAFHLLIAAAFPGIQEGTHRKYLRDRADSVPLNVAKCPVFPLFQLERVQAHSAWTALPGKRRHDTASSDTGPDKIERFIEKMCPAHLTTLARSCLARDMNRRFVKYHIEPNRFYRVFSMGDPDHYRPSSRQWKENGKRAK